MAYCISMSPPPDGVFVSTPRIVGWTERTYRLYNVIMGASQITSLTIVYSNDYSDADQRKHQSSATLAFVRGIHRGPVNSPHKWPVTRKIFPFDDVSMDWLVFTCQYPRGCVYTRILYIYCPQGLYDSTWASRIVLFKVFYLALYHNLRRMNDVSFPTW